MKTHTLEEVQDKLIGKIGTPERDRFEQELEEDLSEHSNPDQQLLKTDMENNESD